MASYEFNSTPFEELPFRGSGKDVDPAKPSFQHFSLPCKKSPPLKSSEIQDLEKMRFPSGLAEAMNQNNAKFPLRVWIVDNSTSMRKKDGSRISSAARGYEVSKCTRWRELRETVFFHAEMAAKVHAPTIFRLLNKPFSPRIPRQFGVAHQADVIQEDLELAKDTMRKVEPKGCTPLSKRVFEIRENIVQLQDELNHSGEKIVVVLATDGINTDSDGKNTFETREELVRALKSLEGLPIWLVIRLCTQSADVVEFYNSLDHQLDLSLEVLDDFFCEAKELHRYNTWINYALPLHRAREMGFHHRLFDLLDERKLNLDEVKEYFSLLFGEERINAMPDPEEDLRGFLESAKLLLDNEKKQYNPILDEITPWVDLKVLAKAHKRKGCTIM
mmetsp:Transcript_13042/g.21569  ORF Transcript_13042/g.21569 Transcript_13042/m.21569 type:complete len:388 (-) Transcript_13042:57-1220(-)|eukprot:CAMPEP_0119014804 /NCGR_PEP_ID=MMETSP1176-20130426/10397_1 /TAXON_ID=265551 /ORGANISM="Synedropsis recta cf, Strain CCMP1620" /LENGTH=387 /DNA_ID=CAMNT_0006968047 /DNA_START=198 /DNA_END=1361 /DNA_ORIENTATION=+